MEFHQHGPLRHASSSFRRDLQPKRMSLSFYCIADEGLAATGNVVAHRRKMAERAAVQTNDHPVVAVSWNDAAAFAEWLSKKEGQPYRPPTEAEWEFACRSGSHTRCCFGDDPKEVLQ
jgi:formylglycine-generating enzyme required for sulfatase activity